MVAQKNIRQIVSKSDLLIAVGILRRVFRRNADITNFLGRIDEPHELDKLYGGLEVLLGLKGEDEDVEEEPIEDKHAEGDVAAKLRDKKVK